MTPDTTTESERAPRPVPILQAERPLDYAAFISDAIAIKPAYTSSVEAAEQLPVLFWLCDATLPKIIVTVGADDATTYFGLCQAATRLPQHAACYLGGISLDSDTEESRLQIESWIEHQNTHYAEISQIIGGTSDELAGLLQRKSVDLLVVHASGISPAKMEQLKATFWPKLSRRATVVITGLGSGPSRAFETFAEARPSFRFNHGTGFGVVAAGGSPSKLVEYLGVLSDDETGAAALRALFGRLGLACRQPLDIERYDQTHRRLHSAERQIREADEQLGLRAARLVHRESEILELRDQLQWHREQLNEAWRQHTRAQVEAKRAVGQLKTAQSALDQKQKKQEQLRLDLRAATIRLGQEKRKLKKRVDEMATLRRQLTKLDHELTSIYQSRSWRITAPLRWILARLRGGRKDDATAG